MSMCTTYVLTHIYIVDTCRKKGSKRTVTSERSLFKLKSQIAMPCPHCADTTGIRILGLKSSWWHSRQANDTIASEQSIFKAKTRIIKVFPCRGETVRAYISASRYAWWQKTILCTRTNYRNHRCTCALAVNKITIHRHP